LGVALLSNRIDAIEKRLTRVEKDLEAFQSTVVKKLTEAMSLIQKHQRMRDARVNQQLQKIVDELTSIREKLSVQQTPPPVMN
jgi:hypothetical protein